MKSAHAANVLRAWDQQGRYVFTRAALAKLFPDDKPKTFTEGLDRLVDSGQLVRASSGIFVNPHARSFDGRTIERVAQARRPGHYNYLSLESMLSEYGDISQIPIDRLTVMTTGRKGVYRTPYGTIEFTHTARAVSDILENTHKVPERPLRLASRAAAWRDLKRVGRNVGMVHLQDAHDE